MKTYMIGDLCTFDKGASIPRARMKVAGDYLYLHYGDLYKGHNLYIDIENPETAVPYISNTEKIKPSQLVFNEDIIYILTSETVDDLGKALLVIDPKQQPIIAGTETTIMRINRRDIILPRYLNYLIQTDSFRKSLQQYVTGMKVFRVHPRDISKITIEIPDRDTQLKVVQMLDALSSKIKLNSKINDYLAEYSMMK